MRIKHVATVLQMMATPGIFAVMKDWKSLIRFHFIHSAIESGLLEALQAPKTGAELARILNVANTELLEALLDVGVSIGELSLDNDRYGLKGKISKSILREKGEALGALIQANVTYYNSAYRKIARRMRGEDLGDDLEWIGDLVARVSKIQEPLIKHFISEAVSGKRQMKMLEIGCGSGAFMRTAYESNNNATGFGIDYDQDVVMQAKKNIVQWGLADRFTIVHGDIRTFPIEDHGPFDFISLYNVLYYFSSDDQALLMRKIRSNLSQNGRFAIISTTRSNGKDPMAANLNLVNCSLKGVMAVPQFHDIREMLDESGFHLIETVPLMPGSAAYFLLAQ